MQSKLKGWETDCDRLESLKRNNEGIIAKIREEYKIKETQLISDLERALLREQDVKQKLSIAHMDREKFKEEINELERLVSNQLNSSS